ncbi:MAG: DUF1501 domain-containing protein [Pirellulales bacterium]
MLGQRLRTCALPRREFLRAGAISVLGLSLPELLAARAQAAAGAAKAKSCILVFLEGGPAHQDLWDMKPAAPAEYRGEFRPIGSSLPGVPVCEHLPRLAQQLHRAALVRSLHHTVVDHNAGAYYALTGRSPQNGGQLILGDEPGNFPPYGAVLAKLRPQNHRLPGFVQLPDIMSNNGRDLPGQRAGFLGPAYDPFIAGDPSARGYSVPGLSLPVDVAPARLAERRELLAQFDRRLASAADLPIDAGFDIHYRRAFELMASPAARRAFDLSQEPREMREAYGLPDREDRSVEARKFGGLPHFGQCLLLARRLVEAGVPLVTVASGRRFDQAWDTHRDHFPLLAKSLLPYFDRGFAALLADLAERGMLEETLVVAVGEFGRTPKLGQITSGAGADAAGRDHWPHCYTALLAGGGVCPGAVFGASDRYAAYPARDAVTPEDLAATIYAALGIEADERVHDALGRPHDVALGKPIGALFAGG